MDNFGTVNGVPKRWWGNTEPTDKKMIWYRNGKAYAYANGEWSESTGGSAYDDIDGAMYCDTYVFINGADTNYKIIDRFVDMEGNPIALPEHFKFAPRTGTNCIGMFAGNYRITNIDTFDTSNVTNTDHMFHGCINLKSIGLLDLSSVKYSKNPGMDPGIIFDSSIITDDAPTYDDSSYIIPFELEYLGGFKNYGKSFSADTIAIIDLSSCPKLTYESVMNVINTIYNFGEPFTGTGIPRGGIILHSDVYSRLSAADIAIANKKGWDIRKDQQG